MPASPPALRARLARIAPFFANSRRGFVIAFCGAVVARDEGGLAHQILGRIAGDGELGCDDQVGPQGGRLGTGRTNARQVLVDLAFVRVELG